MEKQIKQEKTMGYDDSITKSDIMEGIRHELYIMSRDVGGMLEHIRELDELFEKLRNKELKNEPTKQDSAGIPKKTKEI